MLLNVKYLSQFFDPIPNEKNGCCGPTSLAMCASYALGTTPISDDIVKVVNYLEKDFATGTNWNQLKSAGENVFGFKELTHDMWSIEQIRIELTAGRPMIVGVKAGCLTNRGYEFEGGHYIVAIGFEGDCIICNDPAARCEQPIHYSITALKAAMAAIGPHIPNGVLHGFKKI